LNLFCLLYSDYNKQLYELKGNFFIGSNDKPRKKV